MDVLSKCLRRPRSKHVEAKTTLETFNKGLQRSHGGVIRHHILRPCQVTMPCCFGFPDVQCSAMQRTVIIVSIRVLIVTTVQRGRMNSRSCQLHCGDTFGNVLQRPHKGRVSVPPFTICPCQPLEDYWKPRRGTEAQSIFINFPIGSRPG